MDIMVDPDQALRYWESKIIELPGDRLMAVAWAFNQVENRDIPNQYALSADGGTTWTSPRSTGLSEQTLTPFLLDNGRIFNVYRRIDKPGLWAQRSRIEECLWINEEDEPLWGYHGNGSTVAGRNMAKTFANLKFGTPCITLLPYGTIFTAFWCYEECVSVIRWFTFRI
jgi:hypothetical protein